MAVKQFKSESKRLLDLMIHSIYTHKEIFLRELISNASDAIDKLYFQSLTDPNVGKTREDFQIRLTVDKAERQITLSDNGVGMTKDELEQNLGVIARSGTLDFRRENAEKLDDLNVIGQFGVGFYSAFMVAAEVSVSSRAYGADEAWRWHSRGAEGYMIEPCEKAEVGTDIVLTVKKDEPDEHYDEFLETRRLAELVRKYSDYIRYPIRMDLEHSRLKEGSESEYETVVETETVNSMVPLWRRNRSEVTEEEYHQFYRDKFYDFTPPLRVIHAANEGLATYHALLFIPKQAPYNYYTKEFEKGLALYSSGVMIMEKCADLLPDHFSFVRGLVDSQDLSLNISREMLQHDRQLKVIAAGLEKRIKNELLKMLREERETYDAFFESFGLQLKAGAYTGFGENRELLQELLLFYSAAQKKRITLAEYVESMKEEQEVIYYAAGAGVAALDRMPQTELVRERGFDILYLTDDVDEFVLRVFGTFADKKFQSVSASGLDLTTEEEKKQAEEQTRTHAEMLRFMKDALDGKVADVTLSGRLKSHPACLTSRGEVSIEMEKVLNAMPTPDKVAAQKVLELNAAHPLFAALDRLHGADSDKLKTVTEILYNQARLVEGLPVEDPAAHAEAVCALLAEGL
ncbi:MAG: molecular chaperone HtpG [Oscillospiraceae bacterium]|nr:molecular chaperone HtpG [Oscillospiraceae bacterium]